MANVKLTDEEIAVISNADFLLTKNCAIQKLQKALDRLAGQYQRITEKGDSPFKNHCQLHPKIAKGEQYEGLPYLMLDYPRSFSHTDTFAVRSFFWWGHYFSINLLLMGQSQLLLSRRLLESPILGEWHLDTSPTPWMHNQDIDQSPTLSSLQGRKNREEKDFFKISKQLPLAQWQEMEHFFLTNFAQLWEAVSYPNV